jgi:hypothetical protein
MLLPNMIIRIREEGEERDLETTRKPFLFLCVLRAFAPLRDVFGDSFLFLLFSLYQTKIITWVFFPNYATRYFRGGGD